MSDLLYYIIIYPIELIVELVYHTAKIHTGNPGLSIVFVSLVVNLLAYPLYKRADEIQEAERNKQESMSRWNEHIRKHFKGDERVMMRSAYYRIEHYQPYYALKSSISLFLQIPFFISAFHFLSNLDELNYVGFLMIPNLGIPDGLISIGTVTINVLPILMTLINFCSSAIYTKEISWKNKWQLYVIALIFLVLLYDRPSGLVLYWTLNNLFSLLKNILRKYILPAKEKKHGLQSDTETHSSSKDFVIPPSFGSFVLGTVFLTVLMGILIPSAPISSSPTEFIESDSMTNPLVYVLYTAYTAIGLFIVWFTVFYSLATDKVKKVFYDIIFITSGIFLADYLFFGRKLGNMSSFLVFDNEPYYSLSEKILNIIVILVIIALFVTIIRKRNSLIPKIYTIAIFALIIMSTVNITKTVRVLNDTEYLRSDKIDLENDKILTLSSSGKNVVVIMIDRAIGIYVPYIFNEKPELKEQFSGFTYYPNTVAFGRYTNIGTPALFGGYEYTPDAMNKRSDEKLADKQNEADLVLPVIFSESGFKTTVCDPPYVNYHYAGDLSIFEDYPNIDAYLTRNPNAQPHQQAREAYRKNIFFMYSLFKVSPVIIQPRIYTQGGYSLFLNNDDTSDFHRAAFEESYDVLNSLSSITDITDSDINTYFSVTNNLTHEPQTLQLPDYEPLLNVNNSNLETKERTDENGNIIRFKSAKNYHVNMLSFILLGKWMDYLKEQGVYDNTRIIIVSDHGRNYDDPDDLVLDDKYNIMDVIPVLFYKDFNSSGDYNVSDEFMTHADVPTLAVQNLLDDPVNPFTGKAIDNSEKTAHDQLISFSGDWDVLTNNGNTFSESDWYSIHDNVYDLNNWEVYDYYN